MTCKCQYCLLPVACEACARLALQASGLKVREAHINKDVIQQIILGASRCARLPRQGATAQARAKTC